MTASLTLGGSLENGTNHARAGSILGSREDLVCRCSRSPMVFWCGGVGIYHGGV